MNLQELLSRDGGAFEPPRSLYVHIPFCSTRCAYCDFHSFPASGISAEIERRYVDVLLDRASRVADAAPEPFRTIYVGGGTPTVLPDELFGRLMRGLGALFAESIREWTVEANPESLTPAKLGMMKDAGVTRLSVGIQSMDEGELAVLGRGANPDDNRRAIALAARSGLDFSADLMTALPSRAGAAGAEESAGAAAAPRRASLADSARFLAESGAGHLSIYDLVLEEGTRLWKLVDSGALAAADEDRAFEERKRAEECLAELGFLRYEISNYALRGAECLHNRAYWSMNSYLGIGSGAVSTLIAARGQGFAAGDGAAGNGAASDGAAVRDMARARRGACSLRLEEGKDLRAYMEDPDRCAAATWIGPKDSAFEMVMMGLRTREGLDAERFARRFGIEADAALALTLRKWAPRFETRGGRLALDGRGMDILNRILVDALEEMDSSFPADLVD